MLFHFQKNKVTLHEKCCYAFKAFLLSLKSYAVAKEKLSGCAEKVAKDNEKAK